MVSIYCRQKKHDVLSLDPDDGIEGDVGSTPPSTMRE